MAAKYLNFMDIAVNAISVKNKARDNDCSTTLRLELNWFMHVVLFTPRVSHQKSSRIPPIPTGSTFSKLRKANIMRNETRNMLAASGILSLRRIQVSFSKNE